MLDQTTRAAILELKRKGHSVRQVARLLKISRQSVKQVLTSGTEEVPVREGPDKLGRWRDQILDLWVSCEGSRVRVHEELEKQGAEVAYSTITAWLKRHGIGETPRKPAGRYPFEPGEEMQHDTSPFAFEIGGVRKQVQIISLVLCHSRMIYFQCTPRFRRFECKQFLSEAAAYFGAVCPRCMIDNTHVVVLHGTGKDMVPVPEMVAFGERLGFAFAAHAAGDANRSARVEGHFNFIQGNFFKGRTFSDWSDLNAQARTWCDKVNATYSPKLHASRRELFAQERPCMRALPAWLPPVYQLHQRIVCIEGYVHVDTNLYSAPWKLIGKRLEVRETKARIELFDGPRRIAVHDRVPEPSRTRVTVPEHRPPRGEGIYAKRKMSPEEAELRRVFPAVVDYLALLKRKAGSRHARDVRRLLRFISDYPREALDHAVGVALAYGLCDLDRLERLILRAVANDFFLLADQRPAETETETETGIEDDTHD